MARTATTTGVSMTPDVKARWEELRHGRGASEFVRHLLQLEEQSTQRDRSTFDMVRLMQLQTELPAAWQRDDAWAIERPDERSAVPAVVTTATIDMSEVMRTGWGRHQP